MKQQIVCTDCWDRTVERFPGEWFKRICGTAKADYTCDLCSAFIPEGADCAAESMGLNSQPYRAWESDYIKRQY